MFPDFSNEIEYWQNILQDNVMKLQRKHRQIIELLEFAMSSNAKMLETLYSKGSEKNKHCLYYLESNFFHQIILKPP